MVDAFPEVAGGASPFHAKVLHRVTGIDDPSSIKLEQYIARPLPAFRILKLYSDGKPRHSKRSYCDLRILTNVRILGSVFGMASSTRYHGNSFSSGTRGHLRDPPSETS